MKTPEYRDSAGKTLAEYPHPNVAVDTIALTYDENRGLEVLVVGGPDDWALPGTFLHEGEVLADAVQRALQEKAGVHGLKPWQLKVFDALRRDRRGWVLSVAHVCVIPVERLADRDSDRTRLVPADDPGTLIYDHPKMIQLALEELRARFGVEPDPDHLLRETFTLRQLALLHGAVAGEPIAPQELDTFRRYMQGRLDPTGKTVEGGGRPAELFRRKPGATAGRLTAELRTADPMPAWRRRRSGSSSDRRTSGR
ncbi:MAG: NUDIX domain-containing protein [Actinomycetes bacterium]